MQENLHPDPWEPRVGDCAVRLVPVLEDNYAFVLIHGREAVVVDPGEGRPVLDLVQRRALHVDQVWITHGHHDHLAGAAEVVRKTGARLVAPAGLANLPAHEEVGEGDRFRWGPGTVEVWHTPGHHPGHVCYVVQCGSACLAFVGDVLFGCGCGRLFGSPPGQLYHSLQRLLTLPDGCALFCGHEMTESNLDFALSLQPHHPGLLERKRRVAALRAKDYPTLPLHLKEERATNPFLRVSEPVWPALLGLPGGDPLAVFAALRARKDVF